MLPASTQELPKEQSKKPPEEPHDGSWVLQAQETSYLIIPDSGISILASGAEKKEDPRNFNTLQPSDLIVWVF